jgi:hypothetical protein
MVNVFAYGQLAAKDSRFESWRGRFFCRGTTLFGVRAMTPTEGRPTWMEGVFSQSPEVQLASLLAIKDDVIGHPYRKPAYLNEKFVRRLIALLRLETTPADIRLEVTAVLGSIFYGTSSNVSP